MVRIGKRTQFLGPQQGDLLLMGGLDAVGVITKREAQTYVVHFFVPQEERCPPYRPGAMTFVGPIPLTWRQ